MIRLSVLVLQRDEALVLRALGALGAVELTREFPGEETAAQIAPDLTSSITRCDRLLERVAECRRNLGLPRGGDPEPVPGGSLDDLERRMDELEGKVGQALGNRGPWREELEALENTTDALEGCRELGVPYDVAQRFQFLSVMVGRVPIDGLARLKLEGPAAVWSLPPARGGRPVLAMTTPRGRPSLERALAQVGFEACRWPVAVKSASEDWLGDVKGELDRVHADLAHAEATLSRLSKDAVGTLAMIESCVKIERQLLEARQFFRRTKSTVLMRGWVPEASLTKVQTQVNACTRHCCVMDWVQPGEVEGVEAPVLLESARLWRPFELLVTAYGLPRYDELVPTLFVAVSFPVMFGMMFGDVGHGALLALGGWWAWAASGSVRGRDLGLLLLLNGLASAVFGWVYGSVFGIPALKSHALWRDPLETDPLVMMGGAVGLGVMLISVGVVLNIINRLRRRERLPGWLGTCGIAGIVFYWSVLLLSWRCAAQGGLGEPGWPWLVVLGVPLAAWIAQKPLEHAKNDFANRTRGWGWIMATVIQGVVEAFEAMLLYVANTISFVRLAAYAMSHAALLMAAFSLAEEVGRWEAGGALLGAVVIVLGNGVAIVLEGIVAAVQALRLEYYEFFGKFLSGEGRPFRPFSVQPGVA